MISFNKNNLANMFRFSREMFNHLIEFVTSSEPTHTFNIDNFSDSKEYDFLSNREYTNIGGDVIKVDVSKCNNFGGDSNELTGVVLSTVSANVRYYEGNKKFNIVLLIKTTEMLGVGSIYKSKLIDNSTDIYFKCTSNSTDGYYLDVIGCSDLSKLDSIVSGNVVYNTTITLSPITEIYNNIDMVKYVEPENSTLNINVGDYIRIFNDKNEKEFEAKVIKSFNDSNGKIIQLDRYLIGISTPDGEGSSSLIAYQYSSLSSPKLVRKNYLTLPTMNYLNRYLNDNSKIIDLLGEDLMLTPGIIMALNEEAGSPEILIKNDKYVNLYHNGDAKADGFYIVNFKYERVSSKYDIEYKVSARLASTILPGYQHIGGVIIRENTVKSYFTDDENESAKNDLYNEYKRFYNNITDGFLINKITVKRNEIIENIKAKTDVINYNLGMLTRQDIYNLISTLGVNNIIYKTYNYNGKCMFDIIVKIQDANFNNKYEFVQVDEDNLYLYKYFNIIHKIH